MIPDEAVDAAVKIIYGDAQEGVTAEFKSFIRAKVRAALEAAAPHVLAGHLEALAADVKARGDIGKDEGLEAWDYLTWKAKQLRTAK